MPKKRTKLTVGELITRLSKVKPETIVVIHHGNAEAQDVAYDTAHLVATDESLPYDKSDNIIDSGEVKSGTSIFLISSYLEDE